MKGAALLCVTCVLLLAAAWSAPRGSVAIGGVFNPPWFSYLPQKHDRPSPPMYGAINTANGNGIESEKVFESKPPRED